MARLARVVAKEYPHHITQRGNRRQQTFFVDKDYSLYINLMAKWCSKYNTEIWAYCLMPNHVHIITVPQSEDGLRRSIGEAHRRYTNLINQREGWRGHLWQGRFSSYPMDQDYLLAAARYIEFNPVRAGIVDKPWEYEWSSAKAHISGKDDKLVRVLPLLEIVKNWQDFLLTAVSKDFTEKLRKHQSTGRPLGSEIFIERLEKSLNRTLKKKKSGPKKTEL